MGENSKIEWCDHTFNPWIGCQKVSEGCRYCYAERDMTRKSRWADCWGPDSERVKTSETNWRKPIAWDRKAAKEGIKPKVFCASLCDIFEHNSQVASWRLELWQLIEETPNLIWLLLTKRPENVMSFVPSLWKHGGWPKYVWMGVTAENQEAADERIPQSLKIPAPVIFVSIEPMLGPIDLRGSTLYGGWLTDYDEHETSGRHPCYAHGLDWVIVGAESGVDRRNFMVAWGENVYDQCRRAGVPFFGKQDSGTRPGVPLFIYGREIKEFPR